MEVKSYLLPLTGEMLDWTTVSGNPADPVRPLGPHQFLSTFIWPVGIPESDRKVRVTLLYFDLENNQSGFSVEAHAVFIVAFDAWLLGKTHEDIADALGKSRLVKPDNVTLPPWAKANQERPVGDPMPPASINP